MVDVLLKITMAKYALYLLFSSSWPAWTVQPFRTRSPPARASSSPSYDPGELYTSLPAQAPPKKYNLANFRFIIRVNDSNLIDSCLWCMRAHHVLSKQQKRSDVSVLVPCTVSLFLSSRGLAAFAVQRCTRWAPARSTSKIM